MSPQHPELSTPPNLPAGGLRIVPLGGLGEIGRNMTVFEHRGRLLIVDCGVLFPDESHPGVDLILPDFAYLEGRYGDIDAVFLTHAHEDHIGAVPYLLRNRRDIPLIGSRFTLALVEAKLKEHRITPVTRMIKDNETVHVGPFSLEAIPVNHSIPDSMAVAIKTSAGTVIHTGDFKIDPLPLDRRLTDLQTLGRLGLEGVDLLMIDSTNSEQAGFLPSDREVEPVIDRVVANATGRVVVAAFASHVHRIQQVVDIARRHDRQVAFVGRSMVRNMTIARELGYLTIPDDAICSVEEIEALPDRNAMLVCTGSQGEPMAALSRIANRDHQISVGPGDVVLLASSLVPGNENAVSRVINGLVRLGATMVHKGNAFVHVSGHATSGELLTVYNVVRPKQVMPMHGEPRHLRANGDLAVKSGVAPSRVLLTLSGGVVDLVDGHASVVGAIPCGYVFVDGSTVGDISETSLKDRRVLGAEGIVTCVVVVDSVEGKVTGGPQIDARGAIEEAAFEPAVAAVRAAVEDSLRGGTPDNYALAQVVRRSLGRWINQTYRRRPIIVPIVIEA